VALRRPTTGQEDPRLTQGYAYSLHALGTVLQKMGRYDEALRRTNGAVRLRRLMDDGSLETAHRLAHSLDNQSSLLSLVGRHAEAREVRVEARDVWRRQIRRHSGSGSSEGLEPMFANLAESLVHLGGEHLHLGDADKALASVKEAIELYEQLVPDPMAGESIPYLLPKYQGAVSTLGNILSDSGRWLEARDAFRQAVAMGERLVKVNPQAHETQLLDDLSGLGAICSMTGRHEEAQNALERALARFESLARANPTLYESDLARVLIHLTGVYAQEKGPQVALGAAERAVELYRRLAAEQPQVHERALAQALITHGAMLDLLGRHDDAVDTIRSAVDIQRRLAAATPSAHEPALAEFLLSLAQSQTAAGAATEALKSAKTSLSIATRLAESNPTTFTPLLHRARALVPSD
jgi:tetratricopeptide (TPR) repeat protein